MSSPGIKISYSGISDLRLQLKCVVSFFFFSLGYKVKCLLDQCAGALVKVTDEHLIDVHQLHSSGYNQIHG